jgi:anti-sigma B factor antagonist
VNDLARVEVERRPGGTFLRVEGEIDISNAEDISAAIEAAVPNDSPIVTVDLSGTTYLDSAGVRLLFVLAERLRGRRQELIVVVPPGSPIRSVLEITGMTRVITIAETAGPDTN